MLEGRRTLYPDLEPFHTGRLKVSPVHELYFEESGNPKGKPVVFLHGGPGGGTEPKHRRFFDPAVYRIVLLDQRGCGRSTPFASLEENTTWHLVSDIEAARKELLGRGMQISPVFHDAGGVYAGTDEPYLFGRIRVSGPDPEHRSYRSFASFQDPDGNGWLFQEITTRQAGRIDSTTTTFASTNDLASALRRAEAAHGEHEKRIGKGRDENWSDWYAAYMVAEQAGTELPT